jgi:hypothetical protein
MIKKIVIIFLFALISYNNSNSSVIQVGEFLEYNVSYLGVSIANVKVYCDGYETIGNRSVAKIRTDVFTYGHIPLINAKAKMEGWVDKGGIFSHKFIRNLTIRNNPWEFQKIEFDYKQNILTNNKWINNISTSSINLEFQPSYRIHDAIGLFFKARFAATPGNSSKVLTYLDEAPFYTNIRYSSQKENISVDGVKNPVRTIYCKGSADWQKQFGLTGEFEAWFSDDMARIPLKGKLDFIIGKISIELVKYKREGWTPPK